MRMCSSAICNAHEQSLLGQHNTACKFLPEINTQASSGRGRKSLGCTVNCPTRIDCLLTVCLPSRLAGVAQAACAMYWTICRSLADFKTLHTVANLHNYSSAFVACTRKTQLRHLWERPIIHHKMHVGQAQSGYIELDENFRWPCKHGFRQQLEFS